MYHGKSTYPVINSNAEELIFAVKRNLFAIGKILVIILMFTGRVGVLTFGFALLQRRQNIAKNQ